MDDVIAAFTSLKIPRTHATVGLSNVIASHKQYRSLFVNRRLPDTGWSDVQIQHLLYLLSTLDTNNKSVVASCSTTAAAAAADDGANDDDDNGSGGSSGDSNTRWCGVGEREGRVYSSLVSHRHYGFSHGVGRSGDIAEPQPKAVGSTVLSKLALILVMDAIRRGSGLHGGGGGGGGNGGPAAHGILLPMCTGMTMALVLSSLRDEACATAAAAATAGSEQQRNEQQHGERAAVHKRVVLWIRIDQKSCYKAIQAAGLHCVVVPTKLSGDEVTTDLTALRSALERHGESVLAVVTTTSCFAPRVPDAVDDVAKLCRQHSVHHVVNNAYGLQCPVTSKNINRACAVGRVDAVIASTDKNFLVPVGGAVVLSPREHVIKAVGRAYAGRASISPVVDVFVTLLSMGLRGYQKLLSDRWTRQRKFADRLQAVAERHGERLLQTQSSNTISFGITLDGLVRQQPRQKQMQKQKISTTTAGDYDDDDGNDKDKEEDVEQQQQQQQEEEEEDEETETEYLKDVRKDVTQFGAMLFSRCVSGTRVIPRGDVKTMNGYEFVGFGSSVDRYPHAYMTAACAIGVSPSEVNEFFVRLDKTIREFKKKKKHNKNKKEKQKDDTGKT